MRKVDLVSNNGSRPNSVQMINRPSDPITLEQVFGEPKESNEKKDSKKLKEKVYWLLVLCGAIVVIFGMTFVLYCMANMSALSLQLFLITTAFALAFDALIQVAILIGISARQVKCEFLQQPLAYNISPIAQLTKETFIILQEIFEAY